MDIIENTLQRTNDWYKDRIGKVTASSVHNLFTKTKRESFFIAKLAERYSGQAIETAASFPMMHGIVTEPIAKGYLVDFLKKKYQSFILTDIGFIDHPTVKYCGASPDGICFFIDSDGVKHKILLEIKCPQLKGYVDFLYTSKIKNEYMYQMQLQLACVPDAEYCLFMNYYDFPDSLNLQKFKLLRVDRDSKMITNIEKEVEEFNFEIENALSVIDNEVKNTNNFLL